MSGLWGMGELEWWSNGLERNTPPSNCKLSLSDMKKVISLVVNGLRRNVEVEARTTLFDLVREQFGLTGAKLGCDLQVCGACTLLLDGKPVSACSCLAVDTDGCAVL